MKPLRHASMTAMAALDMLQESQAASRMPADASRQKSPRPATIQTQQRRQYKRRVRKQQAIERRVLSELAGAGLSRAAKHRHVTAAWKKEGVL